MNYAIGAEQRRQIEKTRLHRMIARLARTPTAAESDRLALIIKTVAPEAQSQFIGMHAVPLMRDNLASLDIGGLASLKADGLHAHAAFVNSDAKQSADTVLFVTRSETSALPHCFAIDRVFMHTRTAVLFDGELCLRKRVLSADECRAINSGQNVHTRPYLEYPAACDAQAHADGVDVTSDSYQAVYDSHFELVYAAFDCMYLQRKSQAMRPFAERIALVHKLTESLPIADNTRRYRERVAQIQAAVDYAGGTERFALRIFMKPMFAVQHARAAMHAVPACMQGIATDGVIFYSATDTYIVGNNPRLLKWKPEHTADLVVARLVDTTGGTADTSSIVPRQPFGLFAVAPHGLVLVSRNVLADTPAARALLQQIDVESNAGKTLILECVGVLIKTAFNAPDAPPAVYWRPVQMRVEKLAPNSLDIYMSIVNAIVVHLDEAAVVAYITATASSQQTPA